ncbi:DUF2914 domain-containing protein [Caminibacter mediatlanticus]|uniref:D-tyrosyl-tRNA deacylase n=1 Tax=Caminibacter mediatlanticus TB-2 TaxID=391592 RepID=A0AAI9F1Z8_9BACT|nr:DUF2914 domain-containing protein [Caminibacter mediatlanticus]EDM23076.1 D-tyrosyl-tRNA deacylase [Caminibacter mediatlanticus TB-2]
MKKIILLLITVYLFGYEIKEFVTCKYVKNLTPINITTTFSTKDKRVYAFAYFKNIKIIKNIDFIWEKKVDNDWKLYADIKLPIYPGIRWRTYSYITIRPFFKGEWRVSIFDTNKTIKTINFLIK